MKSLKLNYTGNWKLEIETREIFPEKEVEKGARQKVRLKKKKLSTGKEFQGRAVLKADRKFRRKRTETTGLGVLENDYFYPKFV